MKRKTLIVLLAALTAGSFLLLNGCGPDETDNSIAAISAEMETENLTDGTIQMHSVWYNTDNSALASATVTIMDGKEEIFSGTTDASGNLEACTLPCNTSFSCEVTDSAGETLAEGDLIFKLSDDYESLSIFPAHGESNSEQVMEIPTDKTDLRAAVFLTEDGQFSFANLSPYTGDAAASDNGTAEDGSADAAQNTGEGQNTDSSQNAGNGQNADASQGAGAQNTGDAAANTAGGGQPAQ